MSRIPSLKSLDDGTTPSCPLPSRILQSAPQPLPVDFRPIVPMTGLLGGLRYAIRQFKQSPVFTTAAVLTLALGIGGTTAIFTLIHAVMLRSLPVSDPAQLYRVGEGGDCCVEGGSQDRWGFYPCSVFKQML